MLLEAVRRLRDAGVAIELDLVTRDEVPDQEGVRVHHGLTPNSPPLIELYHRADVFCLPTMGDCLPMVLSEAGAVGLPLVSTDVGAISEIVRDGETGLLVPVDDVGALAAALRRLADDPDAAPPHGRRRPASWSASSSTPAPTPARSSTCCSTSPSPAGRRPVADERADAAHGVGHHPRRPAGPDRRRPAAAHRLRRDGRRVRRRAARPVGGDGRGGPLAPLLARLGANLPLAWACFRRRKVHRVVFTDGEQVGIPYAAMTRLVRRRPRHVMIGHVLSPRKKSLLHRRAAPPAPRRRARRLRHRAGPLRRRRARLPARPGRAVAFMVDTEFWRPDAVTPRRAGATPAVRRRAGAARLPDARRRRARASTSTSPSPPPARGRSTRTARPASTCPPT